MKSFYSHISTYRLLYAGLAIHVLFYVSVVWTGWFDVFFSAAALHVGAKGIDFYQILRGAWAYWHGGSLTGAPLSNGSQYAKEQTVNPNVYHPLFTILLGSILIQFNPAIAPYAWLCMKLLMSLAGATIFYWSFRDSRHAQLATFILLASMSNYLELAAWQFHSVLNFFLLLMLISLVKRYPAIWSGTLYWLSLLVKPVGILFLPVLIFKRQWKTAAIGVMIFVLITWILNSIGGYYINNIMANLNYPDSGPNQIITLNALLRYDTHWPDLAYKLIEYSVLAFILLISSFRRINLITGVFLTTVFYLLFYNGVFEYHWSTLAPVIAICLVTCPAFQSRFTKICALFTCLPGCFVVLSLLHIDVINDGYWGLQPGATAWQAMVISKLIPMLLLTGSVLAPEIKPISLQIKQRVLSMREAMHLIQ